MTGADYLALLPWLVLSTAAVALMLVIAFYRAHRLAAGLSAAGLLLTLGAVPIAASVAPRRVTPLLAVDGFALFFAVLIVLGALAVVALAYNYFARREGRREEFYLLVLIATLGAIVLAGSIHYASLLLGLEILSVTLFTLVAYPVFSERPLEAGVKYLILAGVSAAFLLFGIALIYARAGALDFAAVAGALGSAPPDVYLSAGLMLVVVGLGFKLSLVPFHLWTPDVYQGAPAPVTAFLATVSKGAVFALVLRYFLLAGAHGAATVTAALILISAVTILAGNLLALLQTDLKRLLAYSSMAHMGYLLIPLAVGGELAVETSGYYLVAYFIMNLAAFGVVSLIEGGNNPDSHDLEQYRGLLWRRPWPGGVLTTSLLALAGMPVTVGFVAKFYLFAAGVEGDLWLLIAALVAGSALGLFYYLRVIVYLAGEPRARPAMAPHWPGHAALLILLILLVVFGVYPAPVISWVRAAALTVLS